jgi:hypothetical protein
MTDREPGCNKPNFYIDRTLFFEGSEWINKAEPFPGSPNSLITSLYKKGIKDGHFLLDWRNIVHNPRSADMHMRFRDLVVEKQAIPLEQRLARMEMHQQVILLYDSLMKEINNNPTTKELEDLVASGSLPKLDVVVLSGRNETLIELHRRLGFMTSLAEPWKIIPPWDAYVEKARSGEFLKTWREMKGR